jgi:hypothetical protein
MLNFLLSSHSVVLMTLELVLSLSCLRVPKPLIGVDSGNPFYVVAEWSLCGVVEILIRLYRGWIEWVCD